MPIGSNASLNLPSASMVGCSLSFSFSIVFTNVPVLSVSVITVFSCGLSPVGVAIVPDAPPADNLLSS